MMTVLKHTLRRARGQIIGWGIGMFLYGAINMPFYDSFAQQRELFDQMLSVFPKELFAFFGNFDITSYVTPVGYLSIQYFDVIVVLSLGIFAVLMGSGLLVGDEEAGRLDLILAHPVSRASLFWGRVLGFTVATLAILFVSWLGLVLPMGFTSMNLGWGEVALPFLSLFGVLMAFGVVALLLSLLLPSRNAAAMTAGFVLVASYIVTSLDRMLQMQGNISLKTVVKLTPLYYYEGGNAIGGLNLGWLIGLLAASAILAALAAWRFQRRDIRVAGESGWRLPLRRRKAAA